MISLVRHWNRTFHCSFVWLFTAVLMICVGCDMGTYEKRLNEQNPSESTPAPAE